MLRFLREPRWIALLVAVPVGFVICLMLSSWQWDRYEGRKDSNVVQNENMAQPLTPADQVMPVGSTVNDGNLWRPVTATGRYLPAAQVLVRRKPLDGTMGFWVATPLVTADNTVVVVNRGWIRAEAGATSSPTVPPPPSGEVTVEGRIQGTVPSATPAPSDMPVGQVSSLDVTKIGTAAGVNVLPGYIDLTKSDPPQAGLTLIPAPEISEGPHLSYSLQWIAFGLFFIVGVVLLARREIQTNRRERELAADGDGTDADHDDELHPRDENDPQAGESDRLPQDSHK